VSASWRGLAADATLLAASAAAGLGASRLTTSPGSVRVMLPVAATVVSGHVVASAICRAIGRRKRTDRGTTADRGRSAAAARVTAAFATGTVAVAIVTIWVIVGSATWHGLPTLTTVRTLVRRFEDAGSLIVARPTPLPATSGVVLCLAAGAGLVAVLGRALWAWPGSISRTSASSVVPLVPSFGLFAYAAVISSGVARLPATVAYLASACAFLLASDGLSAPSRGVRWLAIKRRGPRAPGATFGVISAALAILVTVAIAPALAGMRLSALPYSSGKPSGGSSDGFGIYGSAGTSGQQPKRLASLDLLADMRAVISGRSQQLMFTATTTEPTYWQVGILSSYYDGQWTPDEVTQLAAAGEFYGNPPPQGGLPVLPTTSSGADYSASVTLQGLSGPLIPAAPTTLSISGSQLTFVPGLGVVDTAYPSSTSQSASYEVLASVPNSNPTAGAVDAASAGVPQSDLQPYVALPYSQIPSSVVSLAHQIVAGSNGNPAAEATALVHYFDNGNFRYTLEPRQVPGRNPLTSFLFLTKAGFCQQFAGAYAVLARIDGLPTRLAVGFTSGTPFAINARQGVARSASYRITGADAHVWPEVYLGPQAGWVSFEPTPPVNAEPTGVGVVTATGASNPSTAPSVVPATVAPTVPAVVPHSQPSPSRTASTAHASVSPLAYLLALAVFLALCGVVMWIVLSRRPWTLEPLRRRIRDRAARGGGPDAQVMARFHSAGLALRRAGLGRRPSETIDEHVRRIGTTQRARLARDPYRCLAELAERASYSPEPCTDVDAQEARRLAEELRSSLRAPDLGRRRRTPHEVDALHDEQRRPLEKVLS
jgi:hypothetical protein